MSTIAREKSPCRLLSLSSIAWQLETEVKGSRYTFCQNIRSKAKSRMTVMVTKAMMSRERKGILSTAWKLIRLAWMQKKNGNKVTHRAMRNDLILGSFR